MGGNNVEEIVDIENLRPLNPYRDIQYHGFVHGPSVISFHEAILIKRWKPKQKNLC